MIVAKLARNQFSGKFNQRIVALGLVLGGEGDIVVGRDAELSGLAVAVVHRTGGKTDAPAAGQFRREGQSGTATRAVAHDNDLWTAFHVFHKLVGGTEHAAIRQNNDFFLPPNTIRRL